MGPPMSGKTSLVRKAAHGLFNHSYKATVGMDFAAKEVDGKVSLLQSGTPRHTAQAKLHLWELQGQERVTALSRFFFTGASAAFVVFDSTDPKSLRMALEWKDVVSRTALDAEGQPVPTLLLANKVTTW